MGKRVTGIGGMVANLIVDQQAMVTSFDARGDRHSGSLACHRVELTTLGRENNQVKANLKAVVEECRVLCVQLESMGDNLCRWVRLGINVDIQFNLSL